MPFSFILFSFSCLLSGQLGIWAHLINFLDICSRIFPPNVHLFDNTELHLYSANSTWKGHELMPPELREFGSTLGKKVCLEILAWSWSYLSKQSSCGCCLIFIALQCPQWLFLVIFYPGFIIIAARGFMECCSYYKFKLS